MPLYGIQGPDGRTYEIEGPAGLPESRLLRLSKLNFDKTVGLPSIKELVDAEVAAAMAVGQSSPKDAGFFENIIQVLVLDLSVLVRWLRSVQHHYWKKSELAAREKIKSITDSLRPEGGDPDDISYLVSSGLGSL